MTTLPEKPRSAIAGEETLERTQRAPRGGWRRRAGKEKPRNLSDPHWAKVAVRESDDPMVALKGLIRLEPRGSAVNEQPSKRHAAA